MATSNTAGDTSAFEQTATRIRELNEKLIQLAKDSGQSPLIHTKRRCRAWSTSKSRWPATANSTGSPGWRTPMRSSSRTSPAFASTRPAKP